MKNEKIKEITSKAIEQLVAALNKGRSEALTAYLSAMAKFHRYSFRNVMLIAMQKPTATHVAGFHAWNRLRRFVKKGEKGILIIAPIVRRKETAEAQEPETAEECSVVAFRGAYVFDISQTDGQPLPEIAGVQGNPRESLERLKTLADDKGIALEFSEDIAPARGTSAGGKITLLPGQAPAEEFATLAHELAHEMLHRDERRNGTSKSVRETEAEAVSFVVCSAIGLEAGTAAQDYIQLYEGDAKLLTESLDRIQQTASRILTAIAPDASSGQPIRNSVPIL